ncbi:hypothetical protein RUM44_007904 [Polyplax serrata]|uniref:Reverse transcriptase zinc-binding domain-containing protein n=1 Tax=Polyplax serrata TaxID=468196 RepID=A0ABR1BAX8_POLSC
MSESENQKAPAQGHSRLHATQDDSKTNRKGNFRQRFGKAPRNSPNTIITGSRPMAPLTEVPPPKHLTSETTPLSCGPPRLLSVSRAGEHIRSIWPDVRVRMEYKDLRCGFLLSQVWSGHGWFKAKLAARNIVKDGKECLWCGGEEDDVDHAVWECRQNRETRTAIIRYLEEVMRMREESLRVRGYKMSSLVQDEDTEDEEERQVRIRWTCQGDRG